MQELPGSTAVTLASHRAPHRGGGAPGQAPDLAQVAKAAAGPERSCGAQTSTAELCLHPELVPQHSQPQACGDATFHLASSVRVHGLRLWI